MLLLLAACAARSAPPEPPVPLAPGVTFQTVAATVSWRVVTVDLSVATLHLSGQAPGDAHSFHDLDATLHGRGQRLVFATNAGIFENVRLPSGLFVSDGVERHALNPRSGEGNFYWKPNGVFWVDATGAHVARSEAYPGTTKETVLATQSGPLLAEQGEIAPGVAGATSSRNLRNAVGVCGAGVQFALSEQPVSMADAAHLFVDTLGCPDALYLDGAISELCVGEECATRTSTFAGILGAYAASR